MADPLHAAATWLMEAMSVTRQEFRDHFRDGSDALLDGLLAHGYAIEGGGRFAVSAVGRVMLRERG